MTSFVYPLLMLPGLLLNRGKRAYYAGMACASAVSLLAAVAWLLAPYALWNSLGFWTMLLWLVPTAAAVFALAWMPQPGG